MSMSVPEVIVFRPEPKASVLVNGLARHGISAIAVEPFDITPLAFDMPDITGVDDIIFTSTFAVSAFFYQAIDAHQLAHGNVWAIGRGTAKALLNFGIHALSPIKADSEHLLAELQQQDARNLSDRSFLLVKGQSGRELLIDVLNEKAHKLNIIDCYRRVFRAKALILEPLLRINWQENTPKILLYTSFEALKASMGVFEEYPLWRKLCIVTVTNSRMLDWAKRQGFVRLYNLANLTHEELIVEIIKLQQEDPPYVRENK